MRDEPEAVALRDRPHSNSIFLTRFPTNGKPYQAVSVVEDNQELIVVGFYPGNGGKGYGIEISRQDAKLLARRIEQCLKATAKK